MARLAEPLATRIADHAIHAACRLAARRIDLRVEGLEHLPATGPAILAARHFHHFYDGCALVAVVPRPLRILVTLDWLENPAGLRLMRGACQMAQWPVVVRSASQVRRGHASLGRLTPAARRQLLAATRECVGCSARGQLLLVFPEGYPEYRSQLHTENRRRARSSRFSQASSASWRWPSRMASRACRSCRSGLEYQQRDRWRVTVRFGHAGDPLPRMWTSAIQVAAIEEQVRRLSGLECATRRR